MPLPSGTPSPSPAATPLRRGRYPTSGPGTRPRLLSDAPEPGWCPPASGPGSPSATPPRPGLFAKLFSASPGPGRPPGPGTSWGPVPRSLSDAPLAGTLTYPSSRRCPPSPSPSATPPSRVRTPSACLMTTALRPATSTGGPQRLPSRERVPSPSAGSRCARSPDAVVSSSRGVELTSSPCKTLVRALRRPAAVPELGRPSLPPGAALNFPVTRVPPRLGGGTIGNISTAELRVLILRLHCRAPFRW